MQITITSISLNARVVTLLAGIRNAFLLMIYALPISNFFFTSKAAERLCYVACDSQQQVPKE